MASPAAQKAFASGRMGIEGLKKMGSVTSTGGRGNHRGKDIFLNYSEEQKIFRYYISVFFSPSFTLRTLSNWEKSGLVNPTPERLEIGFLEGLGWRRRGGFFFFSLLFLPGTYVRIVAIVVVVVFLFHPFLLTCLKPKRVAKPVL